MLPESFTMCLGLFQGCFTAPSFQRFVTLVRGWVLCTGKHTVTGVMRAAGVVGYREHSGYHRFFSRGAWHPDQVGLVLARWVLRLLSANETVVLSLDDTLARHTGKRIASAGMHRDPLLSTATRPFWHFGHTWVVLAVVVSAPWGKCYSLPVLMRLYRTEKVNRRAGRRHWKKTELGAQMLEVVSKAFATRHFVVVADNAYVNRSVVRTLPERFHLVGRGRLDAALYAPPPRYRGMGRPRVRGQRLASPKERLHRRWRSVETQVYGRSTKLQVQVFDALWYIVGRERKLRIVMIRGWPGHSRDDVLVSTDLSLRAELLIELYCRRWSLEETFGWAKSRLGFEEPQKPHRTRRAAYRSDGTVALFARHMLVSDVGAPPGPASHARRSVAALQTQPELRRHVGASTAPKLDLVGF
ncbi:MAG: transposase [Proteobacteria bacterium]|nr:transposase [Pseudomonadota bacterium]